jgi:hypothetical protein
MRTELKIGVLIPLALLAVNGLFGCAKSDSSDDDSAPPAAPASAAAKNADPNAPAKTNGPGPNAPASTAAAGEAANAATPTVVVQKAPTMMTPDKSAATKPAAPPAPATNPAQGVATLADLWNKLDTDTLVKITKDWKDPDLVAVLAQMDDKKVAAYITAVAAKDASHASKLTKQIEDQASVVSAGED